MAAPEVVEHFFGVYLLYCMNPKYKGRTYIGYTVNPNRRIKQHNAGKQSGGAWKTSKRGPWNMVLIVHGFPNSTSALRFEWAWQRPHVSRRLKHLPKKKTGKQTAFDYCLSVMSEMLKVGPWCRLPLTVRWLDPQFCSKSSIPILPPSHMRIKYGQVVSKSLKEKKSGKKKNEEELDVLELEGPTVCTLCKSLVTREDRITCVTELCYLRAHVICLAKFFNKNDNKLIPISGDCPNCGIEVSWGELIRKKIGCSRNSADLDVREEDEDSSEESGFSSDE